MNAQEQEISEKEKYPEVFSKQKVKLYDIKHFILDFGGVMIEKTYVLSNLFSIIQDDLKIIIPKKEPYYKKLRRRTSAGIISSREFLEKLFEKYYYPYQKKGGALPPKKVNVEYYLELWFSLYSQLTKFSYEMEEIIKRLQLAGFTVNLMSNTYDIHAKSNELNGFYEIFDNLFLSNEIGLIKPDIEKYKYVLKKLDTKPKKCVFIDNKIKNLAPARELGFIVIKFDSIEKFKALMDFIGIKSLTKDFRNQIKEKYKQYKTKKKEYKKAKKEYKKAKKEYSKKSKRRKQSRMNKYLEKREIYKQKKQEYEKEKQMKKEQLQTKFKID